MSEPRRTRLVNRLVAVTLLSGLAAALVGGFLLDRSARRAALDDARERNRILAEQYAVRLDAGIEGLLDDLDLVSTRREVAGIDAAAAGELSVVLRASDTFGELVLFDGSGRARAAAASRFLADPADEEPRPDLAAAVSGGPSVRLVDAEVPTLELAVAVEDPPGTPAGVLVARAALDDVAGLLEDAVAPGDPVPALVDEDGVVLVHRNRSRVVDGTDLPIEDVLDAPGGVDSASVDGAPTILAAAPSRLLPAVLAVEQPEDVALASVDDRRRELVAILAFTLAVVLLAVIAAGELLLRPLRPLTAAVSRLGRGERGARTGVEGYAEVGLLAGEVDRLAEALDERDEQLGELRELSLLIGSIAPRREVLGRIASGAARLVLADGAAVLTVSGSEPPVVEAVAGDVPEASELEQVARSTMRTGTSQRPLTSGGHAMGVPLLAAERSPLGVLVVHGRGAPFEPDQEALVDAFAAFAAVAIDNSHRLELQRRLVDQLQDAMDRRRDLIGTITHELRTPLTCIEGFSTALLEGWDDDPEEDRRELVERIAHHTQELEDLVSRFLDFAVAERGGLQAVLAPVELAEAVGQVTASMAPVLDARVVEVEVPPIPVVADPTLLRRTLTNLLSNAVKYSSPGSTVRIGASADDRFARVDVSDQGPGLSAQESARAFDAFWRAGGATTRGTRGSGLGLALVAEYVRAMDGTCGVVSEPGHGSTFFFTLPLAAALVDRTPDEEVTQR